MNEINHQNLMKLTYTIEGVTYTTTKQLLKKFYFIITVVI